MFDFEVRRLSEMTQMLGRRVERLETQDRPAAGTAGGGGTASFNDAAGDPADVSTAAADGVSTWAARLDHVHTFPRSLMFSDAAGNPGTVGTAAVSDGTLTWAARLDHVHAFDRSGIFSDAEGDPADVAAAASDGASLFAARRNHVHAWPRTLMFSDGEGDPVAVGTVSAADGTSTWAARRDHAHGFDRAGMFNDALGTPLATGSTNVGTLTWAARADHVHAGGGGGSASFNDGEGDPATVQINAADGTSTFAARRDHVHALSGTVSTNAIRARSGASNVSILNSIGNDIAILVNGSDTVSEFQQLGPRSTAGLEVRAIGGTVMATFSPAANPFAFQVGTVQAYNADGLRLLDNTGTAGLRAQGGTVSLIDSAAQELLQVVGGVVRVTPATGGTANFFVGNSTLTTGDARIEIGRDRTGEGLAYIDLIGGTVNTNYGARLLRNGEGVTQFAHQGTAALEFKTVGAAPWELYTNNTLRFSVDSTGLLSGGSARLTETLTFNETAGTPVTPGTANQIHMYMRNDRIVFMFRDGTTTRWKSLLMTGTGVTWVAGTVAP